MKQYLERESKWDVPIDFVSPQLDYGEHSSIESSTVDLVSVYYDTAGHDLQSHGVTLRRRTGDDESGWQLKLPNGDGRVELSAPPGDDLPDDLRALLTGLGLGRPLVPVATIFDTRTRTRILGPDDALRYEIDDDDVTASLAGSDETVRWRELEIELGPSTNAAPEAVLNQLVGAGAQPSAHASKLAKIWSSVPGSQRPAAEPSPANPARAAIADYLNGQIDAVFDGDIALRRGLDPIHDTRVALRRLRSTLRVFGPLLDHAATAPVEAELKWFAGELGDVRDCDVQRRHFEASLHELPAELVLGPVTARIDNELHGQQLRARARVTEAMDSARYLALLGVLQEWRTGLPLGTEVDQDAVLRRARKAARKADRRLVRGIGGTDPDLHRARKAAKRARYAAELTLPLNQKRSKRNRKHYKKIQSALGDHQDSVVAKDTLWRLGTVAGSTPGENGFTFGLLYATQQQVADRSRKHAEKLLR